MWLGNQTQVDPIQGKPLSSVLLIQIREFYVFFISFKETLFIILLLIQFQACNVPAPLSQAQCDIRLQIELKT